MPIERELYDPTTPDYSIEAPLTDAIAETQAYLDFLLKDRKEDTSSISYHRGRLTGLKAVNLALMGDCNWLESFSVTSFREKG